MKEEGTFCLALYGQISVSIGLKLDRILEISGLVGAKNLVVC